MYKYIIIEDTCGMEEASIVKASSIQDVYRNHREKRNWLESEGDWEEDSSEIIAVLQISDNSKSNINLLIKELERYS